MDIRGMIFDLDGTLVDTIDDIMDCTNVALERLGFPAVSRETVLENISFVPSDYVKGVLPPSACTSDNFAALERAFMELYDRDFCVRSRAFDGMVDTLTELKRRGIPLAVCTNKPQTQAAPMIEKLYPAGLFDTVSGKRPETLKKPDPTSALAIAKGWGLPPENIAFVGDSPVDVVTAKNAGMHAVDVTWGYSTPEILRSLGAEILITRAVQLLVIE